MIIQHLSNGQIELRLSDFEKRYTITAFAALFSLLLPFILSLILIFLFNPPMSVSGALPKIKMICYVSQLGFLFMASMNLLRS